MLRHASFIALLFLTLSGIAHADWPQFRGPDGQGHLVGKVPTTWSDKSIAWAVDVPGKGWASPVVADGKIWLTAAVPEKAGGHTLRALAFHQKTGKQLHDVELFAVPKPVKLHDRNSPATPTPALDNGRLYAQFGADGVACLDTKSARVLWRNETLKLDYETGPASSPVVYKHLLIFPCDAGDDQFVVALDGSTGAIVWKTARPEARKKPPTSRRAFSTPLVFSAAGRDQVVIPGAFCIYSYDPLTGAELWRVTSPGFSNVPRPVFANGLVYVTTGFATPELFAIRPDGKGDVTKTHLAWRYRKNVPNVPSPIVVGDLLFMISDPGTATCLDAKTGELKWTERLSAGSFSASPLAMGKTIFGFADNGQTVLFEASETFKELGSNELPGRVQATPAAADGSLFFRTDRKLMKVGN